MFCFDSVPAIWDCEAFALPVAVTSAVPHAECRDTAGKGGFLRGALRRVSPEAMGQGRGRSKVPGAALAPPKPGQSLPGTAWGGGTCGRMEQAPREGPKEKGIPALRP